MRKTRNENISENNSRPSRDCRARSIADALSGCSNQQPTQTWPRWTGLLFLPHSPLARSLARSLVRPLGGSGLLCALRNGVQ